MNDAARQRLATVPWPLLPELAPVLAPALDAVLSNTPAADVLDRLLRAHPEFSAAHRRLAAEAVFGLGLWRRRLRAQRPTASPLELLAGLSTPDAFPEPTDWRDATSLPDWLADVLSPLPDARTLADALNLPGPITVRVNSARIARDELARRLADEARPTEPGRWSPDALHVLLRPANLTATRAWQAGLFELQDEGSQLLALAVPMRPGDAVLDLCAGAGGKSLSLATRARATHASDVDRSRLERLRTRADRARATIHLHWSGPPADLRVEHVLVDAPCSELGALRRGPDLRWRLDPSSFSRWPPIQRELLETAARHLTPGGAITYATCTLRPEENEHVVDGFLRDHPEFHLEPIALDARLLDARGCLRTFPHRHGTDGFFAAVLRST